MVFFFKPYQIKYKKVFYNIYKVPHTKINNIDFFLNLFHCITILRRRADKVILKIILQ